jgi:hypothetical protein
MRDRDALDEVRLRFSVLGRMSGVEVKRFGKEIGYVTVNIFGPHANITLTITALQAEKLREALNRLLAPKADEHQ